MGLVDPRRAASGALPPVPCTGPSAGTPAAPLRPVLGERRGLPAPGAPGGFEFLLEALATPLPPVPVAGGARQVVDQLGLLLLEFLDALVPRILSPPGRLRTSPLLDAIVERIPPPPGDPAATLQVVVANLDSSDYLGRIAIGRIVNGRVALGDDIAVSKLDGTVHRTKVTKLYLFDGLHRLEVGSAAAGDIICLAGIDDITIGETIIDPQDPRPIPPLHVDEPTVSMIMGVNTSPMAGRDGQYVTGASRSRSRSWSSTWPRTTRGWSSRSSACAGRP